MLNRPAHLARYTPTPREGAEQMQSLLFASPFDGDGKTLCVMKCARTMVKQGYRTLVIDADFTSQGLSREYSRQRADRHGLAAYLMGEAETRGSAFRDGPSQECGSYLLERSRVIVAIFYRGLDYGNFWPQSRLWSIA